MDGQIAVLDFGGQYCHLIANRVRRLGVYSEILPPTASIAELEKARGVILSGGPKSVYARDAVPFNPATFRLKRPLLGICYGHQLMAHALGGRVKPGKTREYGTAKLRVFKRDAIFKGLSVREPVWMSHGDAVEKLPQGFERYASTSDCGNAAMGDPEKQYYGMQFHPEVAHTSCGMQILKNFVFGICRCKKEWSMERYLKEKSAEISRAAKGKKILVLASGGVDSTVALAMLVKILGSERVYALHIDNGFMRRNESAEVEAGLVRLGFGNFHSVDAGSRFIDAIGKTTDPEKKRSIIGDVFLRVADDEIKKLRIMADEWLIGQGTIYPDTIETGGTAHAETIKTHHNRVESIKELIDAGLVIEPIAQVYKDEVRELGLKLGLPKHLVFRHPFPGPGLAIRALCSDGKLNAKSKKEIKFLEGKLKKIASKFSFDAHVLPVHSVGVQGDARTYGSVAVLSGKMDFKKLERASTRITNEVRGINRVAFLLYPKKINSIKLLKRYITRERMEILRNADAAVSSVLEKHSLMDTLWQCPVVIVPIGINEENETIVLRPVESQEAMTARFAALPKKAVNEAVKALLSIEGIGAVLYDITHKPPATICWE